MGTCKKHRKEPQTLDDIIAGDEVLLSSRYSLQIIKVDRVTSTLIICGNNKYRKRDGYSVPFNIWNINQIQVLTHEAKEQLALQVQKAHCIQQIKAINWDKLPLDVLTQILSLTKEHLDEGDSV